MLKEMKAVSRRTGAAAFLILLFYASTIFMFNGESTKVSYIYVAFALLCICFILNTSGYSGRVNNDTTLILLYVGFGVLSLIWSANYSDTMSKIRTMAILCVALVIILRWILCYHAYEAILFAIIAGALSESVYLLYLYGISGMIESILDGSERIGWMINNVNAIGNSVSLGIVAVVGYAVLSKKRLILLCLIPMGITFIAAGSRTATISVVVGCLIIVHAHIKCTTSVSRKFLNILIGIIIVFILWNALKNIPAFRQIILRIENAFSVIGGGESTLKENSAQTRMEYIELGWAYFLESPLIGHGLGCAGYALKSVYGYITYLHNNYIEILASGGIIGFLLFYAPYYITFKSHIRRMRYTSGKDIVLTISFALLCTDLVAQFGTVVYYSKIEFLLLALWFAIDASNEEAFGEVYY